jgi:DNA repair protein RecO (recombination protein O)
MDERGHGIILRLHPLTETSLIVHWLTEKQGRLSTLAKGARRPASPFRGKLDLFFRAEFSFHRSRRSELHVLREVHLLETYPPLRRDLARLQQAAYAAALFSASTETDTPIEAAFLLMSEFLDQLTTESPTALTVLALETKWLNELGLAPTPAASPLSPGAREFLGKLQTFSWPFLRRLAPSTAQLAELTQFLAGLMQQQLECIPRGRAEALATQPLPPPSPRPK